MSDDLLASVLASPDDDDLRLVYADWVDERGDGDRAAFIRCQVELHRMASLKPAADAFRAECPVLTCVGMTPSKPRYEPVFSNTMRVTPFNMELVGQSPHTFHCRVPDRDVIAMERPGRHGRLPRSLYGFPLVVEGGTPYDHLIGGVVECVMHNLDGTTISDPTRFRFTVSAVTSVERNVKDSYVAVDLQPRECMIGVLPVYGPGTPTYYYQHAPEVDHYNALRNMERELFTSHNLRVWCSGSWFSGDFTHIRNGDCPTVGVYDYLYGPGGVERCRFRFARGFVEETWFNAVDRVEFTKELRTRHPAPIIRPLGGSVSGGYGPYVSNDEWLRMGLPATPSEREVQLLPVPPSVKRGQGVTSNADGTGRLAGPNDVAWVEVVDEVIRTNTQGQSFVTVQPINHITGRWSTSRSTPLEDLETVRQLYNSGVEIPERELRNIVGLPPLDASHLIVEDDDDE